MKAALKACAALMIAQGAVWSGSARADWRDDIGTFRIGIVAEPGAANTVPGLARLTEAFTNALGMKVEFVVARDYAALIDAQANARIEYAVYSATAYATASRRCECVEPLVAPVDSDGAVGIRAVLLTKDGKVPSLAAMETHRIAMPPADSIGSLLPLAGLAAEHVKIAEDASFLVRADSASAAEGMLVDGQADALFGWATAAADGEPRLSGTQARLEAAGLSATALQVAWTSGLLRYGPHAVRSDLDPEAKRRLAVFLTNLKSTTPDIYDLLESRHSGGFATVVPKDYEMAHAIVRLVSDGGVRR
ncbi:MULTISPECIES: PhnD/SsuA/transferrin family substrate-binding protein [unclassified Mesorhizobium]|uniref:phosphate/phosphite/phosphonate ABC transporter substrate-binding protein n=1 Tax=unclassified Mesorhizobium TaxID=325217 RepID=UPI001129BD58|nr:MULTISPECIES: PhnD/SsuA/transferrin family substrate-binding protein [unclassified Mesorhizobium]MBZ9952944.1 PhnD/SsuA/transferrin family substrate-binding protein [Mesorhizobium sp. BR1-1-15]TPK63374.1 phosphonate ABC transporter substrate-binding protein [Mesorhizobium sp. B2-5-1]TPL20420.1 phosphonate ABC transporter substrate-binding protein [Mesorhizobium sp. B2-4-10]TPM58710.1 phosphonate ABC transporter substrate-binding protein [Mesorhizobium sp. B2-1-9]TPM87151.1 phosphonate ABC t